MLTLLRPILFEPTRPWRLLAAAGLVTLLALLFYLGQKPVSVGLIPPPWDKLAHLTLFFVVSGLVWVASGARSPAIVLAAVAIIGFLDEFAQQFNPGRSVSAGDWAMDMTGAVLLIAVVIALRAVLASSAANARS